MKVAVMGLVGRELPISAAPTMLIRAINGGPRRGDSRDKPRPRLAVRPNR
jgi:hypothetical protein